MLNAFIIEKKAISPTSVLKKRIKSQKTSDSLDNLHIDGLAWMVILLIFEKKFVLSLFDLGNEVNTMHLIFAKKLGLWVRLIA